MGNEQYTSRKFMLLLAAMICAVIIPVVFKLLGISDDITGKAIGFIFSSAAAYGVVNVVADHIASAKGPEQK